MNKLKYDVCVIGCGPAGFAAAMRSYDFDNHVCIIEGAHIGGAGIADGALSSKTMWELAKDYSIANRMQLRGDDGRSFTMHEIRFNNGETQQVFFDVTASMGSEADLEGLVAKYVKAKSTMGSEIRINATEEFDGRATMGGYIKVSGNPDRFYENTSMGGDISGERNN